MPDLSFQITGVDANVASVTPLLQFKLSIENATPNEVIHAITLTAQIQIQSPLREYSPSEKEELVELFGPPESWSKTLRNHLWAHASANVGRFNESTETMLAVPCTCDLNIAASKYFHALEAGDVFLLFLFSGSTFYTATGGRLQVAPISWNKECNYRMPARTWWGLMERHYPNTEWLAVRRDVFERLYAYKRRHGSIKWEDTLEQLLNGACESAQSIATGSKREEVAV